MAHFILVTLSIASTRPFCAKRAGTRCAPGIDTSHEKRLNVTLRNDFHWFLGKGPAATETNTVFVIFLAPGLTSSLGNGSSGSEFLAYHNHFHASSGVVRYVVVPFDSERERWLKSARESLTQAIVNPEGNAWY
jgi:hypothetical protein